MKPFIFTDNKHSFQHEGTLLLEVPFDISDKDNLLFWFAAALNFPKYFGWNWDALSNCLRDLSWIDEKRVVIFHSDVPLKSNLTDCRVYLGILENAVEDWHSDASHELLAAFCPACEPIVSRVLGNQG